MKSLSIFILIMAIYNIAHTQTRLATSPLMNKSQISSGLVVNTIENNEGRASFEIATTNGSITYESPSDFKYSDLELKGDSFKIGYDSNMLACLVDMNVRKSYFHQSQCQFPGKRHGEDR